MDNEMTRAVIPVIGSPEWKLDCYMGNAARAKDVDMVRYWLFCARAILRDELGWALHIRAIDTAFAQTYGN